MKKLILIGSFLALTLAAKAQVFESRSFLGARSIVITNAIGITNLLSSVSRGTNIQSTQFTNLNGAFVVTSNGVSDKLNLLKTVRLTVDRNAMMVGNSLATNASIFIRLAAGPTGTNATNSVTFVFAAVPSNQGTVSGSQPGAASEALAAADLFTISTTANTAVPQAFTVKLPYDKFIGDYGIMLRSVSCAEPVSANGTDVWLLECSLNQFTP
jgi:hypothetical protein